MDNFDKMQSRTLKLMVAMWAVGVVASLAVTGVVIWIIVAVLQHFGIL